MKCINIGATELGGSGDVIPMVAECFEPRTGHELRAFYTVMAIHLLI